MNQGALPTSRIYTPEVFLDAIIEWIISDDQVSIYHTI